MSEALVAADMVPLVPVAVFVAVRTTAAVVPAEGSAVSPVAAPAAEVGSRR